ncbi:MAG: sulfotransferase [Fimbriimonas sp.]|nr:sulfotransferase [Fimbriimonas sp.]
MDKEALLAAAVRAHREGRLEEAARIAHGLLLEDPDDVEIMLLLGVLTAKMDRPAIAVPLLQQVTERDPASANAFHWLSVVFRRHRQFALALEAAQKAADIAGEEARSWHQVGICHMGLEDWKAAEPHLQRAVRMCPDNETFLFNLGVVLEELGRPLDAAQVLRRTIEVNPGNVNALNRLGQLLARIGEYEDAQRYARRVLKIHPKSSMAHSVLAISYVGMNRASDAVEHAVRTVELEPGNTDALTLYATILQSVGRTKEAAENFAKSLEIDPLQGYAYFGLIQARKVTEVDRDLVNRMIGVVEDRRFPPRHRAEIEYALGKALADLGEYGTSMSHYDEANRMVRLRNFGGAPFDGTSLTRDTDGVIAHINRDFVQAGKDAGTESELPVFVVGMIRSGTTLVEQILCCHPEIGAAGEQLFWLQNRRSAMNESGELDADKLLELSAQYLKLLESTAPGRTRVIDKLPGNYMQLGLLKLAYPNCRIIHVRRNPVDTCLSIWTTPNSTPIPWANDRSNLVHAYKEYLRVMDHWRTILPAGSFLEVDYEDLVENQETVTRKLVGYCGLEWDNRCLKPQDNARSVATPSAWQVRQPVYRTSVNRRLPFEPFLGEFAELAGDSG